ncbi:NADPH:quinone reductase [Embleya hyalina]|uniref:NADPH:quinone reductase n=2 Tax=Embleya hyalina TaxID=516124 RepID=A0A401YQX9_9ACTN|nr:NADPH:quinone reductase [Embleya hyalina]
MTTTPVLMRAIRHDVAGGSDVLRLVEVERPEPGPTEVLVRVHAAGVNPIDWKTRTRGGFVHQDPPYTVGYDVAGVVEAVGLGVTSLAPGDDVYGMARFPHPAGAYAEYVTAPSRHFARLPRGLDHVHAAALPLAALTAWQALVVTADVAPGQRVLIHGAAGGVGHLAAQIAAARGAHVIGTASPAKHEFLRGLGVAEVVDYTDVDFAEVVRDVDVVLDTIGGDYPLRSLRTLREGGTLVTIIPPADDFPYEQARAAGVRAVFVLVEPDAADLREITELVERDDLRVHVSTVLPLADAAKAHDLGELGRTTGKIVLSVHD